MAQQIDDALKSQYNFKYDVSETIRIAHDINQASRSLSINVSKMKDNLKSFVSAVQVAVKEQSLAEKLLGWLKSIVSIVVAVCSPIPVLLSRVEPKPQYLTSAVSALGKAVAKFCRVNSGAFSEHIILGLK